ncbi:DMT family transporter [Asticcacaulis machinosus]|uniref:DMT family transporter n=1 Tax=Asticcacaulis machinosus TaxID=2984211 RepID=A0ABT5HNA7_9CAUL|nr:DMT family transporter [Asticcacaulis machinosus]MDC7677713.1 DMT family transporter [Asticcacaulis machinosus]
MNSGAKAAGLWPYGAARGLTTGKSVLMGIAAMMVVIAVWTGFSLSARGLGHLNLTAGDAALIRFGLPALLFAPFIATRWAQIRRVGFKTALAVFAGGGLPFYLVAVKGANLTSAAISAALIPGGSVLIISLVQAAGKRGPALRHALCGLGLILSGLLAILIASHGTGPLSVPGTALVFSAGALWALFTLSVRHSGLDPIAVSLVQCLSSLAALAPLIGLGYVPIHIRMDSLVSAWPFILAHGIGTGLLAGLAYAFAIRRIGALRASAIGSLSPAVTAICAGLFLGEPLTPLLLTGAAVITIGVIWLQKPIAA